MTDLSLFRVYEGWECGWDAYPAVWHYLPPSFWEADYPQLRGRRGMVGIKHLVREDAENRCIRCGHPYAPGARSPRRWTPCDERCTHGGPVRVWMPEMDAWAEPHPDVGPQTYPDHPRVEAEWRILTVHHLNGRKHDLRWWNLVALCQRCHLSIQAKVVMEQIWPHEHSEWFKPYAAGWYAYSYAGETLTREETVERLDELLALERAA